MPGTLILCATPIGNLADISERLVEALASADVIFAEDTRRTAKLLARIGVETPMRSYFSGNERSRSAELVELLTAGSTVAVVSDAGTPTVSDPGASAVAVAVDCKATVTAIPGPSAPATAVSVSGFDGDRFVFEGFLPRKGREREDRIRSIADDTRTTVVFCAPSRVGADLTDLVSAMDPDRRVVVARELTKLHEEIWRGTIRDAAGHWNSVEPRGEFTVVIEGAASATPSLTEAVAATVARIEQGTSMSRAVREIATEHGVRRGELYDAVLDAGV
ncbi:MAG: 16S rRNA (cytidine(1402)-2'-O)-methyltransferase [Acidimicrobiia bacterium]